MEALLEALAKEQQKAPVEVQAPLNTGDTHAGVMYILGSLTGEEAASNIITTKNVDNARMIFDLNQEKMRPIDLQKIILECSFEAVALAALEYGIAKKKLTRWQLSQIAQARRFESIRERAKNAVESMSRRRSSKPLVTPKDTTSILKYAW